MQLHGCRIVEKCSFNVTSVRLSFPSACDYWEGRLQVPVLDSFEKIFDALARNMIAITGSQFAAFMLNR